MCGRFVTLSREEVAEVLMALEQGEPLRILEERDGRAQAFPGSDIAAIGLPNGLADELMGETANGMAGTSFARRNELAAVPTNSENVADLRDQLSIGTFRWGFTPSWSNKTIFNTRIESALSGSGMWANIIRDGRCIVPAASFFEPHATETVRSPRTGRQVKRSYEFAQPDGSPLLLAGLCNDGCCSIVTTEPNRWVSPIHSRMPLALRFEEVLPWLAGDQETLSALADRCSYELHVAPESISAAGNENDAEPPAQLSLF